MTDSKEMKKWLLKMMDLHLDPLLNENNFSRRANSTNYSRNILGNKQKIEMIMHSSPRYAVNSNAHIYPWLTLEFPAINKKALDMVNDKILLANTPELTLRQPIQLVAPVEKRTRWLVSGEGEEEFISSGINIKEFIGEFVIPFLEDYSTVQGIANYADSKDKRVLQSERLYIYVASSLIYLNQLEKAEKFLFEKFPSIGAQKRIKNVFDYINNLKKKENSY